MLSWHVFRSVIINVPIVVIIFDKIGYVARVEGISMQPTLNPDSNGNKCDYLFLNKWIVNNEGLNRGDLVVFKSPREPNSFLIKRLTGIEYDVVNTRNGTIKIPKGHCWVEGDNIYRSNDSNHFGIVSMGLIIACATYIVWPPERWKCLRSKDSNK